MRLIGVCIVLLFVLVHGVAGLENETVNETMQGNQTINGVNGTVSNVTLEAIPGMENECTVVPTLEVEKEFYNYSETIVFQNKLSNKSFNFIIEYWVEDDLGKVVKAPIQTSNTNKKQFTPRFDAGEIVLLLKNRLVWVSCNNTNEELSAMQRVHVVNPNYVEELEEVAIEKPVIIKKAAPKKTAAAKPKVNETKDPKQSVKKPVAPKKTVNKTQTKEQSASVKVSGLVGESVINPIPSSEGTEDSIYVGSSVRARSYAGYMIFGLLMLSLIVVIKKQW